MRTPDRRQNAAGKFRRAQSALGSNPAPNPERIRKKEAVEKRIQLIKQKQEELIMERKSSLDRLENIKEAQNNNTRNSLGTRTFSAYGDGEDTLQASKHKLEELIKRSNS